MASATSKYNVFLRIKPVDVQNVDDRMNTDILTAIDSSSITLSHTNKKNEIIKCQYNFEKVFKPSASQSELFDDVLSPKLHDFFQGKDSLVFSYGTSNSGKSFTMQGTRDQPGIIPRVLHAIYQGIQGHIDTELYLRPYKSCQATVVNEQYKNTLLAEKSAILESLHSSLTESHDMSLSGTTSEQVTMHLEDSSRIPCCLRDEEVCSVWISFYEVYNEQIFDLLAFNPTSLQHPLKLGYDEEDDSYHPSELKVVNATTWDEAYDLYRYGKRNLRVSETLLNRKSSRSHSVFSLRMLIRNVNETDQYIVVNSFILCDLAGSERMKHTDQMGKATVKEMLNINASILTLNKCFGSLKADTQKVIRGTEQASVLPYRDSKLTMLFKKFLKGQGQLTMVANMSQEANMYYQTEQILKITSLAYKTRVDKKTKDNLAFRLPLVMPKRRFSTMVAHELNSPVSSRNVNLPNVASDRINPEVRRLREENAKLLEEMRMRDLEQQKLLTEKDYLEASFRDRITQLESHLNAQGESRNFYRVKFYELEEKHRNRVTAANRKELELLSRLDAANDKIDELTLKLQEGFGIEESAGPRETVSKVIYLHNEMRAAATEEVEELIKLNEDLTQEINTLRAIVSERDNEISNLKGQLIDSELMRQREEVRVNNLKPVEDIEADNEVTKSPGNSDNEDLISNAQVKYHGKVRWISDDESSPLYIPPKAKTTAKKKKKTRRINDIPYHGSCTKARGYVSPETSDEILPARRARRQLMKPTEDFLGDNMQLEQDTPPQLSPGAIMKKTLRSGKRRL